MNEDSKECCFGKCTRTSICGERLSCYGISDLRQRTICCTFVLMVTALLIAVIGPLTLNAIVDAEINSQVVIDSTDAPNYDAWRTNVDSENDIDYLLYFFDTQNPGEVLKGAKPAVIEKGPYAFSEYFNKFDITWTDDGDTVQYSSQKYYIFNPEKTGPGLQQSDEITMLWPTVLAFQSLLKTVTPSDNELLDQAIQLKLRQKVASIDSQLRSQYRECMRNNPNQSECEIYQQQIAAVNHVQDEMNAYIAESPAGAALLKILLCQASNIGVSPFWKVNPAPAYFGWPSDPILVDVENLLVAMNQSTETWSIAVPGLAYNYTDYDMARRIRAPTIAKTGLQAVILLFLRLLYFSYW
jgi:hypothetical protein